MILREFLRSEHIIADDLSYNFIRLMHTQELNEAECTTVCPREGIMEKKR